MKSSLKVFVFSLFLFTYTNTVAQDIEQLVCNEHYAEVDFDSLGLSLSHFDLKGEVDICHADSNDSYPYDELIYIAVYNSFDEAGAQEEYDEERSAYEGVDGFSDVPDLGDKAFIQLKVQFGKLDVAYIGVVTGIYTVRIEVNGNYANGSNNRFTPASVLDLARIIVEALED